MGVCYTRLTARNLSTSRDFRLSSQSWLHKIVIKITRDFAVLRGLRKYMFLVIWSNWKWFEATETQSAVKQDSFHYMHNVLEFLRAVR